MASTKNNNAGVNKVFQSPYKDEIEKRLAVGQSPRAISKWLETRGEAISHTTLTAYKNQFFDTTKQSAEIVQIVQEKTKDQIPENLQEVKLQMETEKNRAISTIRAVNHIALLYENISDMQEYLHKLQKYEPVVAAHAAKGIYQEIRATIETLEKIQSNKDSDEDSSVAKLLTKLKSRNRELENDAKQRREEGPTA